MSSLFGHPLRRIACTRAPIIKLLPSVLILLLGSGCRDAFTAFGGGSSARSSTDQLFESMAQRFHDVVRNAKYEYARDQIARRALTPSRVFGDTAVWTNASGPVRLLETFGYFGDARYHMSARPNVPAPARLADGRHLIALSRLADKEYRWDTTVDYAVGRAGPAEIASAISRLIASGEGRTEQTARADLLAAAPRTSRALGTAFSLDTVRPVLLADGSTLTTLRIRVDADGLDARYPDFAKYVRKYVEPSSYRLRLADRGGATYLDAAALDRVLTIKVRTLNGRMVPLLGAPRAMPDTLQLHMDFSTRIKLFTVGFHDLRMEFVNGARGDVEREWVITARREPQWDLPFITARLIRAPLRRPFAGEGALLRVGLRAGEGAAPTVLIRQSRLFVQESAILNFLNSLSSTAMVDLDLTVEREQNAWLREVLLALRDDARSVLTP